MENQRKRDETKIRVAVVDYEKCRPNKCNKECQKQCPVNRTGLYVLP